MYLINKGRLGNSALFCFYSNDFFYYLCLLKIVVFDSSFNFNVVANKKVQNYIIDLLNSRNLFLKYKMYSKSTIMICQVCVRFILVAISLIVLTMIFGCIRRLIFGLFWNASNACSIRIVVS